VKMTPMLRQYLDLKEQAGSALLLYRMGDFYELFFEDAQQAAPVLGITLTRRRQNDSVDAPMCGVPHHAFDGYLGKLLDAGFRVAVAEQVEDPAKAKGLVRREIIRTHTPGTISATELLEGSEHCYLAAFGSDHESSALAWIEISTGTFEGLRSSDPETLTEHLARLRPREVLVAEDWDGWQQVWPAEIPRPTVTPVPPETFSPSAGEQRLRRVLGVGSLRGFGLDSGEPLVGMAGALLGYVESTQKGALNHLREFICRDSGEALVVDRASLRNLEVERGADGSRRGSLIGILDHTRTRMGSRMLHDWLVRPSIDLEEIGDRHRALAELVDSAELLQDLQETLENLPDLERLAARVGLALATPRELHGLRAGLDRLPGIAEAVGHATSSRLSELSDVFDPMPDLAELLHRRLAAEPAQVAGAGVMANGWDEELDEQRNLARGGKELLAGIESAERERTGIGSTPSASSRPSSRTWSRAFCRPRSWQRPVIASCILLLSRSSRATPRESPPPPPQSHSSMSSRHLPTAPGAGTTAVRLWPRRRASRSTRVATRCSRSCRRTHRSSPTTASSTRRRARSCSLQDPTWVANRPTSGSAP